MRIRRLTVGAAAIVAGVLISPVSSQAAPDGPSEVNLGFGPATPATATTLTMRVTYRHPDDPDAKPPVLTHARFDLPEGSRFDNDAVPVCTANDVQLRVLGRGACPAESVVANGWLVGMTGFPAPLDRLSGDFVGYNTGDGVLMVAFLPNTNVVAAFDRTKTKGNVIQAYPPFVPGGPPDLRLAVRELAVEFPAKTGFVTTPPVCPGNGRWEHHAVLSFEDGTTQTVADVIPCLRRVGPDNDKHKGTSGP